jgi:serine/threonine-protein kinase
MSPPPAPAVGQVLGGKYRLLRELRRSRDITDIKRAADVFEAEHVWTGKHFTLKVLAAAAGSTVEMRFLREARAASALVHPNVVKVYDVDRDAGGALFQVQELLEGQSLEEVLRERGRLTAQRALDVLLPIMDALALAHDVGVVHRDVRPGTIFLSRRHDGAIVPKLIDFGVSKLLGARAGNEAFQTVNNASLGTLTYMSPERLSTDQIDPSIDVWAMATVLFETLAGAPPFASTNQTQLAVMIATRDAPHLWERAPEVPPDIAAVVDRALVRKRAERIDDMTVLVADLCAASGHPLPEKSEALIDALAPVVVDTDGVPTPVSIQPPPPSAYPPRAPSSASVAPPTARHRPRIRFGVVGDPDSEIGASTGDRLDRALASRTAVVRVPTYADLVDALAERRIDVAWLAPMAYARAHAAGTVGLFEVVREGRRDPRALLVGRPPRVRSFADLPDTRAAWVDPWSTSGFALQRRALRDRGIDPAIFAAEAFLGSHEAVGVALATGRADVGGIVGVLDKKRNEVTGPWPPGANVVVLAMSEPLPNEVIAVGPSMAEEAAAIREALAAAGVPALATLVGAEIAGELRPVDEERYASLLEV